MSSYYGTGGGGAPGGGANSGPGNAGSSFYHPSGGAAFGGTTTAPHQQQQQQPQQQPAMFAQQQQQQQTQGFGTENWSQWQQPSQNAQQQQPQQQQQQQTIAANFLGQAAAFAIANPNLASGDGVLKMTEDIWKSGSAKFIPGLESTMLNLRPYFAVDNGYVQLKIKRIVFPFMAKSWKRQQIEQTINEANMPRFALPFNDENAPDLYLPSMSLITYVLLCALCFGSAGQFSPEVIPNVTTRCVVAQIIEVLAIKVGFYLMQAPVPFLDLFSYTGYKYLGLCITMLLGGLGLGHYLDYGPKGFYFVFFYTASAASFFMLKTMANNIPTVTAATGPKREVMVLAFAALQFACMWFVSQTKFL